MKLYFQRHGIADWPDWNKSDDDRPLTPDGIDRLKAQAKTLKRLDLKLDLVLSSPLPRAKQTAEIVADKLGLKVTTTPALAPGLNVAKLTKLLASHAKAESVMLVGHEPDFSTCIAGEKRRLKPTRSSGFSTEARYASATSLSSFHEMANGFSTNTCLPARIARTTCAACS